MSNLGGLTGSIDFAAEAAGMFPNTVDGRRVSDRVAITAK
jgi:hypothetical protein